MNILQFWVQQRGYKHLINIDALNQTKQTYFSFFVQAYKYTDCDLAKTKSFFIIGFALTGSL